MNYKDITEALADLQRNIWDLEEIYVENGGEVTEEAEQKERAAEEIRQLLNTEGIDALGEWLKSLEDRKAELKAQRDFVARKIKATEGSIEFVKAQIRSVLDATETDKVKGSLGYSFARTTSTKTSVLEDQLDEKYLELATEGARNLGLPGYIDVALKTTGTRIREWAEANGGDGAEFIQTDTADTVRFTKPRASKKED